MSLLALKVYLREQRQASLAQLSRHFARPPDTMRTLLAHWVRKGQVRCCQKTTACGSPCKRCPAATTEVYEWLGN